MASVVFLLAALTMTQGAASGASARPGAAPDTLEAPVRDSSDAGAYLADTTRAMTLLAPVGATAPDDTVRRRPRAIEVSDAYELRLRIHRYGAYTMIPLFVLQSVAGNQLYVADQSGSPRPGWAKTTHSLGAAGLGALFTVNTVTGLWNLWDSRANDVGRTKRWIHTALMLGSDAGFTWSGIKLSSDAKNSQSGRVSHRRVSYISMGAALTGYGVMLIGSH
ncbi:MAG: putative rane protein [Conexibacter sp.]|nr:putative rane protein [Conexibacter sp.]